jgi:hypothetical protein
VPDLERTLSQLEDAGFHVLLLLAANGSQTRFQRPNTLTITPGCDLAARLEGRG